MRKILLLLLSGALILSLSLPAAAVNVAYDNRNTETDRVVIAQAERPNTAYTGQGESIPRPTPVQGRKSRMTPQRNASWNWRA